MSISSVGGKNNDYGFSNKSAVGKAGAAARAGATGAAAAPTSKANAQQSNDVLALSGLVGQAGGATAQLNLGGVANTQAVGALQGTVNQMNKENRETLTLSKLANELVDQWFAA